MNAMKWLQTMVFKFQSNAACVIYGTDYTYLTLIVISHLSDVKYYLLYCFQAIFHKYVY